LLRFQNETVALVAIDSPKANGPIAIVLKHAALKYVVVLTVISAAAMRLLYPEDQAKAVDEALRVSEFGTTGMPPSLDKFLNHRSPILVLLAQINRQPDGEN
jgi:hypothetical protein